MVFPHAGPEPRHPSQLYEAALEGIVLFLILRLLTHRFKALGRPRLVGGAFIFLYGSARIFVEFFRMPDAQLGYLLGTGWLTMGMVLSIPCCSSASGRSRPRSPAPTNPGRSRPRPRRERPRPAHPRRDRGIGPDAARPFWNLVLFDPAAGYYTSRDPIGADGDFTTAPEISQMFGELLAAWAFAAWDGLGRPSPFTFAEAGPGRGTLMADMLRTLRQFDPAFLQAAPVCASSR